MDILLGCIIVFIVIPIYILLNWKCFNGKKLSPWLKRGNIEVEYDHFYSYQLISSITISLIMIIGVFIFIQMKISSKYFPLLAIMFNISLYIVKFTALHRGYIVRSKK